MAFKVLDEDKKEKIQNYLKIMKEADYQIATLKEHKKDTREFFLEKKYLSKEELQLLNKAYNVAKKRGDMLEVLEILTDIEKELGDVFPAEENK